MIRQILFLLIGLIIGIGSTTFFNNKQAVIPAPRAVRVASPDVLLRGSVAAEKYYEGKMDSLSRRSAALGRQASSARTELQRAKEDNKALRGLVDTLIAHAAHATDTAEKLTDCDSIQTAVAGLMTLTGKKDSLYEGLAASLQAELFNRDSMGAVRQQAYAALQQSFGQSLEQQELLSAQLSQWEGQLKKMKAKNKLLSAELFIAGGIAAYGFIRH